MLIMYYFSYNVVVWHAYNLSFIMRNMFKYMIETFVEDNMIKQCKLCSPNGFKVENQQQQQQDENNGTIMIENLINALMEILVDLKLE